MKNMKHLFAGFIIGMVMAIAPSCGTTKACSSTTCPSGCCDVKGECQAGSSNGACGQLGGTCQVCQIAQACSLGTCSQTSGNGGGNSNGGGAGGGSGGGGGGTTGGGTGGGVTGGGTGGGSTCDGCFFQGGCIIRANSSNNTLCGQGGVPCATCTSTQSCQNYLCVNGTTGGGGGTTGGGGGTTLQPIGGACTSSTSCQGGLTCRFTTQRGDATYPGGYCTKACTTTNDCGGGGNDCIGGAQSTLQFFGEPSGFCAAGCASAGAQSTCRSGYLCEFAATGSPGLCWLNPIPDFNGGTPATNTGVACTSDTCQPSGTSALLSFCFDATLPDGGFSGWTQGYCSADCSFDNTGTFCGSGAKCVTLGTPPNDNDVCLARCTTAGQRSNCRNPGYSCFGLRNPDGGTPVDNICYPDCTITSCSTGNCDTGTGQCI